MRGLEILKYSLIANLFNYLVNTIYLPLNVNNRSHYLNKGAFKYYVIKEVGGWVGQMMMFDDKVGGWG